MNTLLVIAIPLVLLIVGMVLNNIGLSFDQPSSSPEQDPTKRLEGERQAYRKFFDLQRSRFLKRQKRVGQYAGLILVSLIVAFFWIYFDTVNRTGVAKQIAALQTVPTQETKEIVLSVTLTDGSNVKYLIRPGTAEASAAAMKDGFSQDAISSWQLSSLGTAMSLGTSTLPAGIAVKVSP